MGRGRTVVEALTCFHALTEESVAQRWVQIERQIGATPEDDQDAQWSVVMACSCCVGPMRSQYGNLSWRCTRCSEQTSSGRELIGQETAAGNGWGLLTTNAAAMGT